jgi:hypothetical protein
MAQTKKKRRRKHRGTQAGTIERPTRRAAPRTKEERRALARQRRGERFSRPPTWRGAVIRGTLASAAFGGLLVVLFDRPVMAALPLAAFMILLYVPMTYVTDRWMYQRRRRMAAAPVRRPASSESTGEGSGTGAGLLGRLRGRRRR